MGYSRKRRMSYTHTPDWVVWRYPQQYQVLFGYERVSNTGDCRNILRKAWLKWKGGQGSRQATSRLLQGGLIPGGVTVLKNTRGVLAQTGGARCSRDDSRWYSVTSNSSNPQRGTGCSWDDSRWCSVKKTVLFIASHRFCLYQGVSIHTSGLAVASSLMAGIILPSGCGGVYVAGAWIGMAGSSPAGQSLQYLGLWVA